MAPIREDRTLTAPNTSERPMSMSARAAALPTAFDGCPGLFMPAGDATTPSNIAVLIVGTWGLEEFSLRKFNRILAEKLSDNGIASLRFDYTGTGDAADFPPEGATLQRWLDEIAMAAAHLQSLSGCGKLILAGHGLGALLAAKALPALTQVAGLALLAPAVSGRTWARETALWWKLVAADLGVNGAQPEDGGLAIAGLTMPAEIAAEIRKLKLDAAAIPHDLPVLVAGRTAKDSDAALADELKSAGGTVRFVPFEGHESLVVNPMSQKMPEKAIAEIATWLRETAPRQAPANSPAPMPPAVITGPDYRETAIRFGESDRLYGIVCEPEGKRTGETVVIAGTSYDRASGWARNGTETARSLAAQGIASLRFDGANVGDSPPIDGDPAQVLYSDRQIADIRAAIDAMEARDLGPVVLFGRCSGAYAGFRAALADPRAAGVAVVNNYAYVWDPEKDVDAALTAVARPLEEYSARARDPETFRRLMRGEVDIPMALLNITKSLATRIAARLTPLMGSLSARNRLKKEVVSTFQTLEARKVPVSLIYATNDPGLEQIDLTFGKGAPGLRGFANVERVELEGSDHNVTLPQARASMVEALAKLSRRALNTPSS